MRRFLTLIAVLLYFGTAFGQQDPMFTKYMFNSLVFNPAYAGSKDHMSLGILHRSQWVGIDGAPVTQSVTIHTPLKNERVGVGFNLVNDAIGPTNNLGANLSYAYRIPMGENGGKLSIGLQAGVENYRGDFNKLRTEAGAGADPAFLEDPNLWLPNFGAGVYYYNKSFYAGFSSPQLVEYDLRQNAVGTNGEQQWARQYRHYFFTAGGAIPLSGEDLVFKPSFLIKNVSLLGNLRADEEFQKISTPTEFDIDLSVFFYQTLWIGLSYRSAFEAFDTTSSFDSFDIWASYFLKNGLRIGAAYDYTLTELSQATSGSFELFLGYEFEYETKKTVTPRYF